MSIVSFEKDGAVGVVTMAKPPHNLIEIIFIQDLLDAYSKAVNEGCRSILLRSAMRHFCAGADVAGFTGGGRGETRQGWTLCLMRSKICRFPLSPLCTVQRLAAVSNWH